MAKNEGSGAAAYESGATLAQYKHMRLTIYSFSCKLALSDTRKCKVAIMKCLECGREVRNINFAHLRSCSGITPHEYRKKHPGAELVDPSVKKSYGLPLDKNPQWNGGRAYRNCRYCGKPISRSNKTTRCRSCAMKGENNPFFGQRHSHKARGRMLQSAKSRDRKTYFPKRPISEAYSRGRRKYWSKMSHVQRVNQLASFIEAGQKYNKKSSKTKVENTMATLLSEVELTYKRNVQIGSYNVDFLIGEKIIVECFGDYWHCNPKLYMPDFYHRSLHMTAQEKWYRDSMRREQLEAKGYTFYFFWEYDIRYALDQVRKELIQLIQATKKS